MVNIQSPTAEIKPVGLDLGLEDLLLHHGSWRWCIVARRLDGSRWNLAWR